VVAAGFGCAPPFAEGSDTAAAGGGERPSVLIYMIDTVRADEIGCYGAAVTKTPAIDRFAAESTVFLNASSLAPGTRPSVASLMTGMPAPALGPLAHLPPAVTRLPELVQQRGYHTAGVVANPNLTHVFGFDKGFETYHELYAFPAVITVEHVIAAAPVVVRKVREVIESAPTDRPFFLYVLSIDPHAPYSPPPPYETMYDKDADGRRDGSVAALMQFEAEVTAGKSPSPDRIRALYRGEITFADTHFGTLVEWLRETGRLDKTLVVVTADHGEGFLEHGQRGHGNSVFEELTHVPLIVRHPASFPAGRRRNEPVDLLDLGATVVAVAGGQRPAHWVGRDLRDPLAPRPIFSTNRKPKVSQVAVRLDGYKMIADETAGRAEYYHLPEDPGERRPLAGEGRGKAEALLGPHFEEFRRTTAALAQQIAARDRTAAEVKEEALPEDVRRSLQALGYVGE
jgi:arylsulfatase A-like enzyme